MYIHFLIKLYSQSNTNLKSKSCLLTSGIQQIRFCWHRNVNYPRWTLLGTITQMKQNRLEKIVDRSTNNVLYIIVHCLDPSMHWKDKLATSVSYYLQDSGRQLSANSNSYHQAANGTHPRLTYLSPGWTRWFPPLWDWKPGWWWTCGPLRRMRVSFTVQNVFFLSSNRARFVGKLTLS